MSEEIKTTAPETAEPTAEATVEQAPAAEVKVFKTFATEEEFANAVKSERSKAKHEILTELGVKNVDDAKAALAAKNQLETVQATVTQLQEKLVLTENEVAEAFKNEALTLAKANLKEGVDLDAALKEVLAKFPNMKKTPSVAKGVDVIGTQTSPVPNEAANVGKRITSKYPWIKI